MNLRSFSLSRRARIVLAVTVALLVLFARHQISQMDGRFFQRSTAGAKGLIFYLLGDYSGAAKAYREHWQEAIQAGWTSGDAAYDALLRKDYETAKSLSQKALAQEPSAIAPLLTLGEIALEQQRFTEAFPFLEQVLKEETDQFEAILLSSIVRARMGGHGEAIDLLNRGLRTGRVGSRIGSFLLALEMTGDLAGLPSAQQPLCLLAH